jgi:hypothetical protein
MKLNGLELVIVLVFVVGGIGSGYGFDVPVHDKITAAAANGASGLANYLQDNNITLLREYYGLYEPTPAIGLNVEALIRYGSIEEDGDAIDAGGARSLNHFYDPTTKHGLSVGGGDLGLPSQTWGTLSNAVNPTLRFGGFNVYAWQNARSYQSNSIVTPWL